MKFAKLLAAAAVAAVAMGSQAAWAQTSASDDVTASATIIAPLTLTAVNALRFGNIVKPSSGSETLIIETDGSEGGDATRAGGAIGAGSLTVTGDGGSTYNITVNTNGADINLSGAGTAGDVKVGTFTVSLDEGVTDLTGSAGVFAATMDSSGTDTISLGGTLTVAAAATGAYTGVIPVTVDYN